jgi:D-beta-D-heptose 7-phosphate kinase/D-beta-D-heptose 1-phosphate adenosyltransferase
MDFSDLAKTGYLDFSDLKIAVIGDCMLDIYHYGIVDRISPEAPVPIFKFNNSEPEYRLGGACNTALNLSKLGVQTSLFGFVGKDINATYIKQYLLEYNINYGLYELNDFPTITKNRYFSKNQQIIRIDHENTDGEIYDRQVQDNLVENILTTAVTYDAIIISDYGKGAVYHPVLNSILTYCHEDLPIFVDPKINNWKHYENAFCITPNWNEFKEAVHAPKLKYDNQEISNFCRDQCYRNNIEYILITLGSKGMILFDREGNWTATAAEAEEVFDVSGAGDTVIATVAAAYCKEYPMTIAMKLATMAAKVVIGKLGTYAISDNELKLELLRHIKRSNNSCE